MFENTLDRKNSTTNTKPIITYSLEDDRNHANSIKIERITKAWPRI